MGEFGAAVSAMKCVFLWNVTKVQKFALPSCGKRESARVSLALVPDLSNYAVFIAIHDAYHGFSSLSMGMSFLWKSHGKRPMRWDRHKLLWDGNGTDKYVPWTTLWIWECHYCIFVHR